MKRLVLLCLLLSPVLAYSSVDSLLIDYTGSNVLSVDRFVSDAKLVNFSQQVYMLPYGDGTSCQLENLSMTDGHFSFNQVGDFDTSGWSFDCTVSSDRLIYFIDENPVFPYHRSDLPVNILPYLESDLLIDSTSELSARASELVVGTSDYLSAVIKLAEGVYESVTYSFTEPFVGDSLSGSSTLLSELGVCDEFAILFMSLARSVGIPCRYVTGYSFGNVLGLSDFGPHAWVEVFVPGHGWVGVDPTYGQFGWIDASHVGMVESWNVSDNYISTSYVVQSSIGSDGLSVSNELPEYMQTSFGSQSSGFSIRSEENESYLFDVDLSFSDDQVASGDYVLVNFTITNPTNSFVPLSYSLISTPQVELINASVWRGVLLEPLSTISHYTVLKMPSCQRGMLCFHPLEVYLPLGGSVRHDLTIDSSLSKVYSLSEFAPFINDGSIVESVIVSDLSISPNLSYGGVVNLSFSLWNNGNTPLSDLGLNVFGGSVVPKFISLGVGELINLSLPVSVGSMGVSELRLQVKHYSDVLGSGSAFFVNARPPGLMISYNGSRSFSSDPLFDLFIDNPFSVNVPSANLTVVTPREEFASEFVIGSQSALIDSGFPESYLWIGDNDVSFRLDYVDDFGTHFSDEVMIVLSRTGEWWEELIDGLFKFFSDLF